MTKTLIEEALDEYSAAAHAYNSQYDARAFTFRIRVYFFPVRHVDRQQS